MTGMTMNRFTTNTVADPALTKQRGDFLLEALIGMVLMAIVSMGVVYVTSKASVSQKDMQVQEIAIAQLRHRLQSGVDLCAANQTITLPGGATAPITTQGCDGAAPATLTAVIEGFSIAGVPSPVVMSASLGAEDCDSCRVVVGGKWQAEPVAP